MNYPLYRKYVGIEVWFKILDETHFIEIKKLGGRLLVSKIEAIQFPEKIFIQDMIAFHESRWEQADQDLVEKLLVESNQI